MIIIEESYLQTFLHRPFNSYSIGVRVEGA